MNFRRQRLKRNHKISNVMRRFIQTSVIVMAFIAGMAADNVYDKINEVASPIVFASELNVNVDRQEEMNDVVQVEDSVFDNDIMINNLSFEPSLSSNKSGDSFNDNMSVGMPGVSVFDILYSDPLSITKPVETLEPPLISMCDYTDDSTITNTDELSINEEVETQVVDVIEPIQILEVPEPEPEIPEIRIVFEDITITSNATREQLDIALDGTWLAEYSWLYYELEQQYGINAFIAIATSIQETGWNGNSKLAVEKNNIYGIRNGSYNSKEECIRYYFDLMSRLYVSQGYISMDKINTRYCPPDQTWCTDIYSIAMKLNNKVMTTFT